MKSKGDYRKIERRFFQGLIFLFLLIAGVFYYLRNIHFAFIFFGAFLAGIFFVWVIKLLGLNERYSLLIIGALWLDLLGEAGGFYRNWVYYDKILHFIDPIFIAMAVKDYLKKYKIKYESFVVISVIMGFLAFFEIFEYFIEAFFGFPMLGVLNSNSKVIISPIVDTMWDLILGLLGTLTYLFISWKFNSK